MNLNTFVEDYIPAHLRRQRDFTSGRGWVHLYNQLIRRFEREGLIESELVWEVPVMLKDWYYQLALHRESHIRIPADFAKLIDIFEVDDINAHHPAEWEGGRLKLLEAYEDTTIHYLTGTTPFQVATGGTSDNIINSTYSADDTYQDYGIYFLDGDSAHESRIIAHSEDQGGNDRLFWRKPLATTTGTADWCVLLTTYLVMRYLARYPTLSAHTDSINVGDGFNTALVHGLCWLASPIQSKERALYKKEFEGDLGDLGTEVFTPSMEEARPKARHWPKFSEEKADDIEYIGE